MRIGFLSTYPPIECGIATYTRDLETALRKQGHETFILSGPGATGENVHRCMPPDSRYFAADAYAVAARLTPDLIHIQHEFGLFGPQFGVEVLSFITRCQLAGIPVVTTLHTVDQPYEHDAMTEIARRIVNESTAVIVHEPDQKDILIRHCGTAAADRIHVIPHGVRDIPKVPHAKKQLGLAGKQVILLCGYFRPTKGFHRALEFMPGVLERNPDAVLVLSSKSQTNDFQDYRRDLVRKLQSTLPRNRFIVFRGQFPQHTFDTVISAADIMVMPYQRGAQSGVMAQCLAMEAPIVASDLPAFVNAIESSGAGLIARSDREFEQQIHRLLNDTTLREEVLTSIRRYKQANAWEQVAARHTGIYDCIVNGPEVPGRYIYVPEMGQDSISVSDQPRTDAGSPRTRGRFVVTVPEDGDSTIPLRS